MVISPRRKSIRPMTNKTIQHGLSEMFLIKLDSIAAIAKKGPVIRAILAISIITLHIRDTERLYIIKKMNSTSGLHVHVPQRSQRLLRNF